MKLIYCIKTIEKKLRIYKIKLIKIKIMKSNKNKINNIFNVFLN